jgi:hypothetical protein
MKFVGVLIISCDMNYGAIWTIIFQLLTELNSLPLESLKLVLF